MKDVPKRVKRLLGEAAGAAYEEELRRALLPVAGAFKRWEPGALASGDLSDIIHRFHQGPSRELFLRYNTPYLNLVPFQLFPTNCRGPCQGPGPMPPAARASRIKLEGH
jgi:hypothetical protein